MSWGIKVPAGNRLMKSDSGAVTLYTYDAANRLLLEKDATGRTTFAYHGQRISNML